MSGLSQTLRQVRFTNTSFWRNPASAFFTFAFPLMFLVIFTALLGNDDITLPSGGTIALSTYYVAAMATFGVIGACYTNIAISVSFQRDTGILKRTRGTPLPAWVYLAARVAHSMLVGVVLVVITAVFGVLFYDASPPAGMDLVRFGMVLLVGGASFAALGLAVTAIIPNADASPAIVNATILPILFLSGIFIPLGANTPAWIETVGNVFPVKHFADAMTAGFVGSPLTTFEWSDVLVIGLWGVAGLLAAVRFFSWEPRR